MGTFLAIIIIGGFGIMCWYANKNKDNKKQKVGSVMKDRLKRVLLYTMIIYTNFNFLLLISFKDIFGFIILCCFGLFNYMLCRIIIWLYCDAKKEQ